MIAALVLAGGEARRFGGADKAFLPLHGRPLIAHLLARLAPQADAVAISANGAAGRFAAFDLPVLPDGRFAGRGPLAGLAAGLAWAARRGAASLVSVPVDTPFIPFDLVRRLAPAPAVAVHRGRQHHLVARFPVDVLPALERFLATDAAGKVRDFLLLCDARQAIFEAAEDPFLNVNQPADLALAAARPAG